MRSTGFLLAVVFLTSCAKVRPPVTKAIVEAAPTPESSPVQAVKAGELLAAALKGDLELVQSLVSRGANVNENVGVDGNDLNPLLAAISKSHADVALFLLDKGASSHASYGGYRAVEFSAKVFGPTHPLTLKLGKRS